MGRADRAMRSYIRCIMTRMFSNRTGPCVLAIVLTVAMPRPGDAQSVPPQVHVTLPTVTVTAQKEPADPQTLPVSVTLVPLDAPWNGGLLPIGDASHGAPNTYLTGCTAPQPRN